MERISKEVGHEIKLTDDVIDMEDGFAFSPETQA
jgi:hypothetical protein